MRTFAGMFVGGVAAILALKLVFGLLLPLLGVVVGLAVTAIKIVVFVAVAWFVYSLVRGRKREETVA